MAVHRLVDGVVEHFPDEVVQPGRSDAADIHAGPLADGLETLENRDVFRGVVGGGHVYNLRLLQRCCCARLLCLTIVAAFSVGLAAAPPISEDVPVPAEVVAVARSLGLDPPRDRARFLSEFARLLYTPPIGKSVAVAALLNPKLIDPAEIAAASAMQVPVPLSAAVWSRAIFKRTVPARSAGGGDPGRSPRGAALLRPGRARRRDARLSRGAPGAPDAAVRERGAGVCGVRRQPAHPRRPGGDAGRAGRRAAVGGGRPRARHRPRSVRARAVSAARRAPRLYLRHGRRSSMRRRRRSRSARG